MASAYSSFGNLLSVSMHLTPLKNGSVCMLNKTILCMGIGGGDLKQYAMTTKVQGPSVIHLFMTSIDPDFVEFSSYLVF